MFNIIMPRLGSRDNVSDRDRFCMYKVMVGEKVNLPEFIFLYWLQAFKDTFHAKEWKNYVPYEMLFIQIIKNNGVDVSVLEPSISPSQLKGLTFVKIGVAYNFLEYAQKYIKRKVKKEEPRFGVE